ncbi:hypothetical protein, partial [Streptomyces sp. NPDC056512]|uniref:hypothetical protein n=1 Tax=Streptomyces sp. NPDC056512 TaxID=3345846 RepID=UPI0036D0828E
EGVGTGGLLAGVAKGAAGRRSAAMTGAVRSGPWMPTECLAVLLLWGGLAGSLEAELTGGTG